MLKSLLCYPVSHANKYSVPKLVWFSLCQSCLYPQAATTEIIILNVELDK